MKVYARGQGIHINEIDIVFQEYFGLNSCMVNDSLTEYNSTQFSAAHYHVQD